MTTLRLEELVTPLNQPPHDSGQLERYPFVDEMIQKLVEAEMRAIKAEDAARFCGMLLVVVTLMSAGIICGMAIALLQAK